MPSDRPVFVRRDALHFGAILLATACWLSGTLFGLYILIFFGGARLGGVAENWNTSLAGLYDLRHPFAIFALATHFVAGGVLMLFGPSQLIGGIRFAYPGVHRWLGRAYVLCGGLAGLGGLGFIADEGTIGGTVMDLGFGLYGASLLTTAALTFHFARIGSLSAHRAWAIRLFALTVGSWLYRLEYGFWFTAVGRVGHTADFTGWFDRPMMFLFYMPNLIVAEFLIRGRMAQCRPLLRRLSAVVVLTAGLFVIGATWVFAKDYWMPGISIGLKMMRSA